MSNSMKEVFTAIKAAWANEDVRKRLLFTILMVVVVRVGAQIPVPGTDASVVAAIFSGLNNDAFNIFNSFTGGSMESFSILALSITPYITSSIIIELLTIAIPKLEELQRDGTEGRKKMTQYTRYLTVVLSIIEAVAMSISFGRQGLFTTYNAFFVIVCVFTLTAGSTFLMWVGEKITEKGVGNGISVVLLVNILAGIPEDLGVLWTTFTTGKSVAAIVVVVILLVVFILAIIGFVVWLNGGVRKIRQQNSRKTSSSFIGANRVDDFEIKVMTASVIPVIFASSLMSIPAMIAQLFGNIDYSTVGGKIIMFLSSSYWFSSRAPWYYSFGVVLYLALIFVFAYFYTSITFNPREIAKNLKDQGTIIPGYRPGKATEEHLNSILNSVVFIGACGLSIVALIPIIVGGIFAIGRISFLGTSMIIIVGVILETLRSIAGRMVSRKYDSIF